MSPRRRSKRSGCFVLVIVVAGLVVFTSAMELFWLRVDQRRFPWAYEDVGRPTLTGTWVGILTTARGARRALYLDLRLEPLDRGGGRRRHLFRRAQSDKLEGELRMCGGPREQRFTLTGNNVTDDATRFRLAFYPMDSVPPDGLAPSHLRGMWNQRDSLRIEADLYLRRGRSAISDSADPETGPVQPGALHRAGATEYATACARLRASG